MSRYLFDPRPLLRQLELTLPDLREPFRFHPAEIWLEWFETVPA